MSSLFSIGQIGHFVEVQKWIVDEVTVPFPYEEFSIHRCAGRELQTLDPKHSHPNEIIFALLFHTILSHL
jgi:hypothetical protein